VAYVMLDLSARQKDIRAYVQALEAWILANNHPVARGEIQVNDDRIAITVTRAADIYDFMAGSSS
jgi:lipoate-protein ligase B